MSFADLPWHTLARPSLHAALHGIESCCLTGSPGTGKSALVRAMVAEHELAAPDTVCSHILGRTSTANLMLSGVMRMLQSPPAQRTLRQGGDVLLQEAAKRVATTGMSALVIDEAENASTDALFHLMLVRELCASKFGHAVAFILIGTPPLPQLLAATGQLGQRVPVIIDVPLLDGPDVLNALASIGPRCSRMVERLGKQRRALLERDLIDVVKGSVRRLESIVLRAERYAAQMGVPMSEDILRAAMDQQAD